MTRYDAVPDDSIREMLERRSRGDVPPDLRSAILVVIGERRQARRPWHARIGGGGRSGLRLLAIAALVVAGIGAGVTFVGGRPEAPVQEPAPAQEPVPLEPTSPVDEPSPTSNVHAIPDFPRPFEYRDLPDVPLAFVRGSGDMVAWVSGGTGDAYPMTADGSPSPGSWGITLSAAQGAVTHACGEAGEGRFAIPEQAPGAFLDELSNVGGIAFGERVPTTFQGFPALAVDVDVANHACEVADYHVQGSSVEAGWVELRVPSRLVLADVDGMTIVVQTWAATEEDLARIMPTAARFLDGVHFLARDPDPSATPLAATSAPEEPVAGPGPKSVVPPFDYPDAVLGDLERFSALRPLAFIAGGPASPDTSYPVQPGDDGVWGITFSTTSDTRVHPCPMTGTQSSRVPIREDASGFLADLDAVAGVVAGPLEAAEVAGLPATAVRIDPDASRCGFRDIHLNGGGLGSPFVRLDYPTRLIVVNVGDRVVVIQVWATTDAALDEHLPEAEQFLDALRFTLP